MDSSKHPHKEAKPKKVWAKPEISILDQSSVEGGLSNGAHENFFTPNHTHYHYPGGPTNGPFPAALFNNYVS